MSISAPRLPRFSATSLPELVDQMNNAMGQIERAIAQVPQGRPYIVAASSPARSLDAGAATASTVALVLSTLIRDLQARSIIG